VGILFVVTRFRPLAYRISTDAVIIERPWWPVRVPFGDLARIEMPVTSPGFSLGLFRADGFFGTYGLFWNRAWGRYWVYVSDARKTLALVLRSGTRIIVSPNDPEAFTETLVSVSGTPRDAGDA